MDYKQIHAEATMRCDEEKCVPGTLNDSDPRASARTNSERLT